VHFFIISSSGWRLTFAGSLLRGLCHNHRKLHTCYIFSEQVKIIAIMAEMSKKEIRKFLMQGTFTGKLTTVKKDGSCHIVPIWFVLDDGIRRGGSGIGQDIIFTTDGTSVKVKNIQRDNRVSICVDDQTPPFSFVIVYGTARIHHCTQNELFKFATKIAQRYMGKDNAERYGRRNSNEGEVLVRIKPTRILAEKDIAGWD
jgi:PPOX class probable F420-dependent enzyme